MIHTHTRMTYPSPQKKDLVGSEALRENRIKPYSYLGRVCYLGYIKPQPSSHTSFVQAGITLIFDVTFTARGNAKQTPKSNV